MTVPQKVRLAQFLRKEGALKAFVANTAAAAGVSYWDMHWEDDIATIRRAFHWRPTPQHHDYWQRLDEKARYAGLYERHTRR